MPKLQKLARSSNTPPYTNSTNFLVEPLVAFAARLRCRTFEMPASQEVSASPDVKINIGFLPETLFHWYYYESHTAEYSMSMMVV